jgi:HAD superfamily hydrolase (TIGR01509 family)
MPRLALFDLDDTLIGSYDAFTTWTEELVAERGLGDDAAAWFQQEHFWRQTPYETFQSIGEHFGLPDDPARLLAGYQQRQIELLRPYDGMLDGLAALRDAGWRIGIVTNGFPEFQLPKIQAVELGAYVDVVCVSDAEASWKPDPGIFKIAAERAGAPLEGAWMVGDSLGADIAGGNGLGLHTAWVQHGRTLTAEDPQPEHVLERPADVFPLILGGARAR